MTIGKVFAGEKGNWKVNESLDSIRGEIIPETGLSLVKGGLIDDYCD